LRSFHCHLYISKDLIGTRRHQEAAKDSWEASGRQTQTLMTLGGAKRSQEEPEGGQEELRRHWEGLFDFLS